MLRGAGEESLCGVLKKSSGSFMGPRGHSGFRVFPAANARGWELRFCVVP